MDTIEQEYQNKLNSDSKEELINRVKELENKLYGMCEMKQKIDLLIMRDCDLESNTFKKLREIEIEYSKKLDMCLA